MRISGLVLLTVLISGLHYLTDPSRIIWHLVYQHLYYGPVILGAYWYGMRGGLLTAILTSLLYLPHIHVVWSDNIPYAASQYMDIVLFHLIGLSVGFLAGVQRRLTIRDRRTAASLEATNRELRESYEHLRHADRLSTLGQVAAGLAHEIRNPLASVKGALEIISSRANADDPEGEFSQLALKELGRLDALVTEFLTYARPQDPELIESRLADLLVHVATFLRPEAERVQVTVEFEPDDGLPTVRIDPRQIEQVFLNVVLNGIQASPPGTCVRIRGARDGDDIVVDVIDEGPGIAPEHRDRVFDPFFTTKDKGTGLGLAVSYRIVTAHGGSIDVGEDHGKGTRVRIRLPACQNVEGTALQ